LVQPIASHAIAAAARRSGVPMALNFRDDMPPIETLSAETEQP
jgi:multisubunit Na+/H+ antiporter MnhG subunit